MASGITRPLCRSVKTRMFSAAAAAEPLPIDREPKAHLKKLDNGLTVGTIETLSPVARLAVVARAGSRFETGENLGVSHFLRRAAKLGTADMTSFGITRALQQMGGDLTVEGTREYVYIKSNVSRNYADKVVEVLRQLSTNHPSYQEWQVEDLQVNSNTYKLDLAFKKSKPEIGLVELLHSAAFRDTLGQSVFMPEFMIGNYTPHQVNSFLQSQFAAGNLALVGVGVEHDLLVELGQRFELYPKPGGAHKPAVYRGGEVIQNTGGDISYVALAMAGPNVGSKDLLAAEVLRCVLGSGSQVKYSTSASSFLTKASAQVTDAPHQVSGFSVNYSDAGLLGFTVIAPNSAINQVVRAAAELFKNVLSSGISDADLARGKAQLKAGIAMDFEKPDVALNWIGEQALNSDQILTLKDVLDMVDDVTAAQVNKVAKTISQSKPSLAATGNTSGVPYLDDLIK